MRSWIPELQTTPKSRGITDSRGSRRQPKTPNGLSTAAVIATEFGRPLSVPLVWPPLGLTPGAIAAPAPRSPFGVERCASQEKEVWSGVYPKKSKQVCPVPLVPPVP